MRRDRLSRFRFERDPEKELSDNWCPENHTSSNLGKIRARGLRIGGWMHGSKM